MPAKKILGIALIAALLPLTSSVAADRAQSENDRLEHLAAWAPADVLAKIALAGGLLDQARVEALDSGLVKVTIPMSDRLLRKAHADRNEAAKTLFPLAVWASLLEQSFAGQILSVDVAPLVGIDYNFGWVSANFGDDETKKTTFQLKGGGGFKFVDQVDYDASAFNVFTLVEQVADFGVRKLQVKIKGGSGGTMKSQLCFDCA